MNRRNQKSAVVMADTEFHKRIWNIQEINTCRNMHLGTRTYRYVDQAMWRKDSECPFSVSPWKFTKHSIDSRFSRVKYWL